MAIHEISKGTGLRPAEFSPNRSSNSGKKAHEPVVENSGDHIEISDKSRDLLRIRSLVNMTPEDRAQRLEQLTTAIDQGSYHVDAGKIAQAIIRRHLMPAEA
ncbi:MAG: flagellar biosynthesis anti-sigma factor FlgM [Terriglobia bacterium]